MPYLGFIYDTVNHKPSRSNSTLKGVFGLLVTDSQQHHRISPSIVLNPIVKPRLRTMPHHYRSSSTKIIQHLTKSHIQTAMPRPQFNHLSTEEMIADLKLRLKAMEPESIDDILNQEVKAVSEGLSHHQWRWAQKHRLDKIKNITDDEKRETLKKLDYDVTKYENRYRQIRDKELERTRRAPPAYSEKPSGYWVWTWRSLYGRGHQVVFYWEYFWCIGYD